MRTLLLYVLLITATSVANAGIYDKVIVPIAFEKVGNDTLKQELSAIISGNTSNHLHEYKTKGKRNLLIKQYKSNGWWFYITLPNTHTKGQFRTIIQPNAFLFSSLRFRHVKYMEIFNDSSLSAIHREITSQFAGQRVNCAIRAYISKDRFRKYLHFYIKDDNGRKSDYILFLDTRQNWQFVYS